jgi:hypothetical protein
MRNFPISSGLSRVRENVWVVAPEIAAQPAGSDAPEVVTAAGHANHAYRNESEAPVVVDHAPLAALTELATAAPGCVILGCVAETPLVTVTDGAVVGFGIAVTRGPTVDADQDVIDSVPFVFVTETTRYLPASAATGV